MLSYFQIVLFRKSQGFGCYRLQGTPFAVVLGRIELRLRSRPTNFFFRASV